MAVEFELLGNLAVRVDGRPLQVGPLRQRCVLAVLLMAANRAVSTDQLLERAWVGARAKQARESLYTYLSRLRAILADLDEVRLTRQTGRYVLTIDPVALDLNRFEQLTRHARTATDDGQALARYEEALGLWRGEPLEGLTTPWLDAERDTLQRRRLVVELDRNEIALRRGQHNRLLPGLSARAETFPLDERIAGQLMLALYRGGRQADALDQYLRTQRLLADEVGTDPSPALRELYQKILTAAPDLVATATRTSSVHDRATRTPKPPVPRQLPPPPPFFTARTRELAALTDAATDPNTEAEMVILAVSGVGGIGKTSLVLRWAHDNLHRFPDGQLYVNLRGFDPGNQPVESAEAMRGFLGALGIMREGLPLALDAQSALYRSLLANKRMLVLLDNVRDAEQVRPLLPGASTCLVLVTSRNQLTPLVALNRAKPVALDVLSTPESAKVLARRVGDDHLAAEPEAVDVIVAACAGLPLALTVAAARAQESGFPLAAIAAGLEKTTDRLDTLDAGDATSQVRAVFSWSYLALTPDAARLFRRLALHPGPDISAAAAASLDGRPPTEVRRSLTELTRVSLLTEHLPGRYSLHDLVRAYAAQLVDVHDPVDFRRDTMTRILDHYLHTAHAADQLLNVHRDPIRLPLDVPAPGTRPEGLADHAAALAWYAVERRVLLALLTQAVDAGLDRRVWQLAWALSTFLYRQGHWHDQAAAWRMALAAAHRLGAGAAAADACCVLGRGEIRLGRHDEGSAYLHEALRLWTEAGDLNGQAEAHSNLAYLYHQQGRPDRALDHAERCPELYRAAGDQRNYAYAINGVGWHQALLGNHTEAIAYCERALVLLQRLDDRQGEAATWDSLGYAHHHLGNYVEAVDCYSRSLELRRYLGAHYTVATTLTHLGDTQHDAGNAEAAVTAWRQALEILDDLGHPDSERVRAKLP